MSRSVADQQRLEAYLAQQDRMAAAGISPRPAGTATVPLSFAQQQIWLHAQLAPALPLYHEPLTIRRRGPLDVCALEAALTEIVRRHEAWRTSFGASGGEPVQTVRPPWRVRLPVVDLTALPPRDRDAAAVHAATEDARRPFDLERGPLVRALLVRLDDEEHRLYLTVHHIVVDGVSIYRVLLPELVALYEDYAAGRRSTLPEPPVQYADFALWQRTRLGPERLASSLAYWRRRLADLPVLALPTDRPRPAVQTFAGARHRLELPARLSAGLRTLARREGSSLFMTLLAAFTALLHRLTGQDDLALGTVSAGRARPELERLLGFFANPVPLRSDLRGDPSFTELLGRVREETLEALAHDDVPFELLVNELGLARDAGRNPVFQVAFSLEAPRAPLPAGWEGGHQDVDTGTSKFDLYLELDEGPETIVGRIVYRTDLFEAGTIERLAGRYVRVLEAIVADPQQRLSALPLVDAAERAELLGWSVARAPYPAEATVHGVFEDVAARTPAAVALVSGEAQLTYAALDRRAGRLAARLRGLGVGPDTAVGVCLERSLDLVVAFLAVLKAGGAYVPLDPAYPGERLRGMQRDAGAEILVTRASLPEQLGLPAAHTVRLDDRRHAATGSLDRDARCAAAGPDSLAYIMFTSGSTGRPKGVAIPHRAILRLVFGQRYARLDATRTLLLHSGLAFDASTLELWGALLHGGRAVLVSERVPTAAVLAAAIRRHRVTTVWLTASFFNAVVDEAPEALAGVEEILTGGEALSATHVRRACERLPGVTLVNGYGPTECTTFACCYRIPGPPPPEATSVPIGGPIANTEAYVLDAHRQLVPPGVAGELYLGGPGLARGYVDQPELTRERFVPHPFDAIPGARLYRTGDRARWRADGVLEFLGRTDDQVKIRGFRVEPGEIETVLAMHPGVKEVVVLSRERGPGERELVAYVVAAAPPPDAAELRAFLRACLPAFMIPAAVVTVPALPLTPSGKVDRPALAALGASAAGPGGGDGRVRPRNPLEAQLVALWEEVLGVQPVGVTDDFFALGGHSLSAVRVVQQIERLFGQTLPLGALHANATVEDLARALLRGERARFLDPVLTLNEHGHHRPFFFFHGDLNGGGFYCRELARHLGPEQPLVAIHPLGLDGRPVPATIEGMAAEHLAEIRRRQPHGPYFIGGYCNGGLTAYEVARALVAAGEHVEPVVLIAAAADRRLGRLRPFLHRLAGRWGLREEETADYFGRLRHLADRFSAASPRRRVRLALGTVLRVVAALITHLRAPRASAPAPLPLEAGPTGPGADELVSTEVYARYFTAVMAYVPRPLAGRVLAFWPSQEVPRPPGDPTLGWGGLVREVEIVQVPADHHTIVTRHTELIARTTQARGGRARAVSAR